MGGPSASLRFRDIAVGSELPPLDLPVTATVIVAGAIASRDFMPVHHDRGFATAQGAPDIFMNILTTNGLVGRYVTDWAGPDARLRGLEVKLGAPNMPGDTMKMSGQVSAIDEKEGTVSVEIAGSNSWGDHVTGSVTVVLPGSS